MKLRLLYPTIIVAVLIPLACTPKATPHPVDTVGTMAAVLARQMDGTSLDWLTLPLWLPPPSLRDACAIFCENGGTGWGFDIIEHHV